MAAGGLHLDCQRREVPAKPHGPDPEPVHGAEELLLVLRHVVNGFEQGFLCECRCPVKRPADPDTDDDRGAGTGAGKVHGLDHELLNLIFLGGEEHGDPGHVLGTRTLGQYRDGELLPGLHVDGRHPHAGVVVRVVPGERVYDIGPERDFLCCPAHPFRNRIVELLREGNIGGQGQVHDRDPGVLAHRDRKLPRGLDVLQDIGKLAAGYRVRLGTGGIPDHLQHVQREADDGFTVRLECGIGKGFVQGVGRRGHLIIFWGRGVI